MAARPTDGTHTRWQHRAGSTNVQNERPKKPKCPLKQLDKELYPYSIVENRGAQKIVAGDTYKSVPLIWPGPTWVS